MNNYLTFYPPRCQYESPVCRRVNLEGTAVLCQSQRIPGLDRENLNADWGEE